MLLGGFLCGISGKSEWIAYSSIAWNYLRNGQKLFEAFDIPQDTFSKLIHMNDEQEKNFLEIVGFIQEHL